MSKEESFEQWFDRFTKRVNDQMKKSETEVDTLRTELTLTVNEFLARHAAPALSRRIVIASLAELLGDAIAADADKNVQRLLELNTQVSQFVLSSAVKYQAHLFYAAGQKEPEQ